MKKLLALLMAVALCMGLLAGVAMAEDENLASAKGLLDFMYKSKSRDKLTVTAEDYTVINQLMIDGVVYPVTWAVDLDTIQVQPAEDGKYTIVLDKANAKETTYTLTGHRDRSRWQHAGCGLSARYARHAAGNELCGHRERRLYAGGRRGHEQDAAPVRHRDRHQHRLER